MCGRSAILADFVVKIFTLKFPDPVNVARYLLTFLQILAIELEKGGFNNTDFDKVILGDAETK